MHSPQTAAHDRPPLSPIAPGERLLIGALQVWIGRGEGRRTLVRALAWRTSRRVAAAFAAWMGAVEAASLGPLAAVCPHCGGASQEVQRLVVACGLAPVDLELGAQLIAPLVREADSVMVLARLLNAALAEAGWPLPARLSAPPPQPQALAQRTLH